MVPLASLMGRATEALANRVGEGVGGLLNATFGNACELIIAFAALRAGFYDIVKASIAGSIIGNILLVLGGSMLAGGIRFESQTFNRTAATASATSLDLNFTPFEVLGVVVSVIILSFVATDGECNWLEGAQLLATYAVLATAFYFA